MNGKELIRLLEQNGWKLNRIHGSHHVMIKGGQTEIIPVHGSREVGKGLAERILKRTGLK